MRGFLTGGLCLLALNACTIQSSVSNRYLTAENLWTQKNYAAAVLEFDRIVKETPNSALGLQALWRASMTRTLFLNEQEEALKGFETFLERASSSELAPQARKEMGEIYFSKLNQYHQAIDFYQKLIDSKKFNDEEQALFRYRVARAYFHLGKIKKSIELNEALIAAYPQSSYSVRAKLDLANSWYAIGETDKLAYAKALKIFQDLAKAMKDKKTDVHVEAVFGEAATREELDQLEDAYTLFKSIEKDYPAPNVVKIRLARLDERLKKKRK